MTKLSLLGVVGLFVFAFLCLTHVVAPVLLPLLVILVTGGVLAWEVWTNKVAVKADVKADVKSAVDTVKKVL